jgi:hypothetical protein
VPSGARRRLTVESSCFGVRNPSRRSRSRALKLFAAIEFSRVGNSLVSVVLVECATSPAGDLTQQAEMGIDHAASTEVTRDAVY